MLVRTGKAVVVPVGELANLLRSFLWASDDDHRQIVSVTCQSPRQLQSDRPARVLPQVSSKGSDGMGYPIPLTRGLACQFDVRVTANCPDLSTRLGLQIARTSALTRRWANGLERNGGRASLRR
jgi:hypothetical protein